MCGPTLCNSYRNSRIPNVEDHIQPEQGTSRDTCTTSLAQQELFASMCRRASVNPSNKDHATLLTVLLVISHEILPVPQ